jgi:hypothetical protein
MVSKLDTFLHRRFVCCRPGGRRGNMEQVVTRWRRLMAFMKTLDLLHPAMLAVLHRRTTLPWLSKWPGTEVHSFDVATSFV